MVPGAQAHAAFCSAAEAVIRPDDIHTSVRTAMLAAYASAPGAALVTPALRELLAQPPEVLTLALAMSAAAAGAGSHRGCRPPCGRRSGKTEHTTAVSLLDRLLHHAVVVVMKGTQTVFG